MSGFKPILKALDEIPKDANNRFLIVELSNQRLAWAVLRQSSVWTYAVVLSNSYSEWGQEWHTLTANLSNKQIDNLLEFSETPGGPNILPTFDELTNQIAATGVTHVMPVGKFAEQPGWDQALKKHFHANLLSPLPEKHLPINIEKQQLRAEIEKFYSPVVPDDYFLESFEIKDEKLTKCSKPLLVIGDKPPIITDFKNVKLLRPIPLAGSNEQSKINVVVRNSQGEFATGLKVDLPFGQNRFQLRCWFNYNDDGLRLKTLDGDGHKDISSKKIEKQDEKGLPGLPSISHISRVDIVWIVDGTMRSKPENGDWQPDIEPARDFIKEITAQLIQEKGTDIHCALALYGDRKYSNAKYVLSEHSLREINSFHNLIKNGTDIDATDDLDYEAALEQALQWANKEVVWRSHAKRYVVVIGYAPPHFPARVDKLSTDQAILVWQNKYGFTHEPFTAKIDYEQELDMLKKSGVTNLAVWVPYDLELGLAVPWMKYSRYIWSKIGDDGKYFYQQLDKEVQEKVFKTILDDMTESKRWISVGSIAWPLVEQLQNLRSQ